MGCGGLFVCAAVATAAAYPAARDLPAGKVLRVVCVCVCGRWGLVVAAEPMTLSSFRCCAHEVCIDRVDAKIPLVSLSPHTHRHTHKHKALTGSCAETHTTTHNRETERNRLMDLRSAEEKQTQR